MNILDLFGSQPKFQLGDHLFARYTYEESNDEVVQCKTYGIVTGITFCKEYSMYPGWVYTLETYKSIHVSQSIRDVDTNSQLSPTDFHEDELYSCPRSIKALKVINNLKLKSSDYINKNRR